MDDLKAKALQATLISIERQYGKGAIMKLGDAVVQNVQTVPTGSLGLDQALGVGGWPRGRIVEIYGPESSGKTTLALHAIASVQAGGDVAAFIDAEHAMDPAYARKLGVKTDELLTTPTDATAVWICALGTIATMRFIEGLVGSLAESRLAATLDTAATIDGGTGEVRIVHRHPATGCVFAVHGCFDHSFPTVVAAVTFTVFLPHFLGEKICAGRGRR